MTLLLPIILLPAAAGVASFLIRSHRFRRVVWVATAATHLAMSIAAAMPPEAATLGNWIGLDCLSAVFLVLTSLLFLGASIYGIGYVAREPVAPQPDLEDGSLFRNEPESVFTGGILLLLATMSLAILSRHLALQWVAIEATTLASAPLIYYHQNRRSLEAAWKYLILCSVGIAVALLGIFFLLMAMQEEPRDLTLTALLGQAAALDHKWLSTAFIFMLVGYGTKMGLAPLHSWLPDAHSEAPSPVSALLSGALLNCAFLGILRVQQVCAAAGMAAFGGDLLILFGLLSMGLAGVFILRQADYKRMLAYSSVEHMGILAVAVGMGGLGLFGAMLHAVNHSIVKAMLFFTAGNILSRFHTKDAAKIQGVCSVLPISGALWIAGFLAITGSPPFGTFISEFTILRASVEQGRWIVAGLYSLFLLVVFVGMSVIVLRMALGQSQAARQRESWTAVLSPVTFTLLALLLGVYLPAPLADKLHGAAGLLGGLAK
ncbi:MAG TPA: proton-conducting transporter membrane subunit [Sedimentisphaerales bacterium]|jgi:hydrogenase-4 component F|nr:proton-conducting transporter membrane subunit [Sedimentisphaerales bacterium]HNU29635.1 proton-conducting transporter membrane subunit [Sedimentisphaerales bacterium]